MTAKDHRRTSATTFGTIGLLAVSVLHGCAEQEERYHIQGRVSYQGAAVEEGTVMFLNPETQYADQAPLEVDGSYSIEVPPGQYRVVVEPLVELRQGFGPEEWGYKRADNIPPKYRQAETTDFSIDVQSDTEADFDMTASPGN